MECFRVYLCEGVGERKNGIALCLGVYIMSYLFLFLFY